MHLVTFQSNSSCIWKYWKFFGETPSF